MKIRIIVEADELGAVTVERTALRPPPPPMRPDGSDRDEATQRLRSSLQSLLDHTYAQIADAYRLTEEADT